MLSEIYFIQFWSDSDIYLQITNNDSDIKEELSQLFVFKVKSSNKSGKRVEI